MRIAKPDLDRRSDSQVIAGSLEAPESFEIIFDRHFASIFGYLARRIAIDDAGDVAAEVFVAAFEGRTSFNRDEFDSALPWLFGIASNLSARHYRQTGRRARAYERSPLERSAHFDADAADARVDAHELRTRLQTSLDALPDDFRDVVLLVAVHGLSYAEASQALHVPIGTVQSRLARAKKQLRANLGSAHAGLPVTKDGSQ